jgi:hypothetical protein
VFEPEPLDLDDGSHPRPIVAAVVRAGAERLGDVGRRVLDDAVRLLAESLVKDVVDGVELDPFGAVGGEVSSLGDAGLRGGPRSPGRVDRPAARSTPGCAWRS